MRVVTLMGFGYIRNGWLAAIGTKARSSQTYNVARVRQRYRARGGISQHALAREHGVSEHCIQYTIDQGKEA